jgi:hypothetical protein
MNVNDFLYKQSEEPVSILQTRSNLYMIFQMDNQHESAMKSSLWTLKFLLNSIITNITQRTSYYDKADKITVVKYFLKIKANLDSSLFTLKSFEEIKSDLSEPTLIAAEHGYDILTRNLFQRIRLRIFNDENLINSMYFSLLKILFDVDIYKQKD